TTCSSLHDQVSGYERLKEQIKEFQDAQMNIINDKVAKLDADLLKMDLHLEEKFYPHLLTTISAICRAIEKGMQSGLAVKIDHGKTGRSLADVDIMNLLHLESPLVDAHGMSDLQPDIEQLTLPIHRSEDQAVLGETSLSFALSTSASVPAIVSTTTALSTTFASTSSIPPIIVDDYEIVSADGQEDAGN
ncbi:hypothetical protein Tco_1199277, partial [Tanacetum coccineum]